MAEAYWRVKRFSSGRYDGMVLVHTSNGQLGAERNRRRGKMDSERTDMPALSCAVRSGHRLWRSDCRGDNGRVSAVLMQQGKDDLAADSNVFLRPPARLKSTV